MTPPIGREPLRRPPSCLADAAVLVLAVVGLVGLVALPFVVFRLSVALAVLGGVVAVAGFVVTAVGLGHDEIGGRCYRFRPCGVFWTAMVGAAVAVLAALDIVAAPLAPGAWSWALWVVALVIVGVAVLVPWPGAVFLAVSAVLGAGWYSVAWPYLSSADGTVARVLGGLAILVPVPGWAAGAIYQMSHPHQNWWVGVPVPRTSGRRAREAPPSDGR